MDQEALALLKEISAKIDMLISLVESRMPPRITRNYTVDCNISYGITPSFESSTDAWDSLSSEVLENFEKEV